MADPGRGGTGSGDRTATPFGYTRPLAPLFVLLLAGDGMPAGYGALARAALVSILVDLRLCAEIKAQAFGVLRWFLG